MPISKFFQNLENERKLEEKTKKGYKITKENGSRDYSQPQGNFKHNGYLRSKFYTDHFWATDQPICTLLRKRPVHEKHLHKVVKVC